MGLGWKQTGSGLEDLFSSGPEASMKAIERAVAGVLTLGVLFTAGCGERHSNKEVYYLIATNVNLPYWQTAAAPRFLLLEPTSRPGC